jgi:lipopolysaccharide biosynthesis glycosyltransferase
LRARVEASVAAQNRPALNVHWHDVDIESLSRLREVRAGPQGLTFLRLLVPDVLPHTISRVIYLDSDLVVVDDLSRLWDMDMGGMPILAARDRIGTVSAPLGLANWRELGIPADTKYFNAGVLVLDLERWRREHWSDRLLAYLVENEAILRNSDQDGFNALFGNDWREIDFRWNWQVMPDRRRAKAAGCWGMELTEKSVVHFVTSAKPWLPGSGYPERALFYRYVDRTAWRGWRVSPVRDLATRLKRGLQRAMPTALVRQ